MGITNKNQIIDATAIENGCRQLVEVASQFTTHAETLENIASQIDSKVLSADNEAVDDDIEAIATEIKKFEGIVSGIAEAIIKEADHIFVQEQGQLNTYLASLEEDN